jgi:hypothetical protein
VGSEDGDHEERVPPLLDDAAVVKQLRAQLRWLGSVYAHHLAEGLGVSFAALQPLLEHLAEQGHVVICPAGAVTPGSVVIAADEAHRRKEGLMTMVKSRAAH